MFMSGTFRAYWYSFWLLRHVFMSLTLVIATLPLSKGEKDPSGWNDVKQVPVTSVCKSKISTEVSSWTSYQVVLRIKVTSWGRIRARVCS